MKSRILYICFSLFLIWHTLALFIGPAPGSYTMGKIYPIFKPYFRLFHLENYWAFFAPDPGAGFVLRYIVIDKDGKERLFELTKMHRFRELAYFRHNTLYSRVSNRNDLNFAKSFANYLCKKKSSLGPRSIQFVSTLQIVISRKEYLEGKRPFDKEFVKHRYADPINCQTI